MSIRILSEALNCNCGKISSSGGVVSSSDSYGLHLILRTLHCNFTDLDVGEKTFYDCSTLTRKLKLDYPSRTTSVDIFVVKDKKQNVIPQFEQLNRRKKPSKHGHKKYKRSSKICKV
ncbi:hypothetical protein AB6A40_003031 [Gnathostoma spinigerum]|uniref:Uncharacterized protein n=1 Tax=Gnathostoma spinigerum TaxID=75299 RepID=A0ABD6EI15_9BILA